MVIQTRIHDGIDIKTRTYREVYGLKYNSIRIGFYLQRNFCKWGEMIKLKGTERIVVASFGKVEV